MICNLNKKVCESIERWRNRKLGNASYPYVYGDSIYLEHCWGEEFKNVLTLVAIGMIADGYREIIGQLKV